MVKMDPKNNLIKSLIECIEESIELESDDSEKEDILIGLSNLCKKASHLPTKRSKKHWIKPWRQSRKDRGSFSFLTTELLLTDEASYNNYLRLSKTQFNYILNLIEQDITRGDTQMRDAIPAAEKLALTLRFLATGESFRSMNYQSRVSCASISGIVPEVCLSITKRMIGTYLKFPSNPQEWETIAKEFAVKWQFPNCVGALDGKHINFRPPRKDGAFYHNYKGYNSIISMALTDAHCKFIYVDIGCNGRSNDAGVFLESILKKVLENEIPQKSLIHTTQKSYPYHTNSKEKQVFNARLSRARHVVEHSFGILANRFRVFMSPINLKVETVEAITFACCVLHNYLLQSDSSYVNGIVHSTADSNEDLGSLYNPRKGSAEAVRQQFTEYFINEGKLNFL